MASPKVPIIPASFCTRTIGRRMFWPPKRPIGDPLALYAGSRPRGSSKMISCDQPRISIFDRSRSRDWGVGHSTRKISRAQEPLGATSAGNNAHHEHHQGMLVSKYSPTKSILPANSIVYAIHSQKSNTLSANQIKIKSNISKANTFQIKQ